MVAPVFREPAFVWACVALMGGCALAALALWQRRFLLGCLERFVRLPPSSKAVIVTAVVIATVFAQKPANVATDSHGFTRIEEVSATLIEEPTAFNTEETEGGRHGEGNDVLDRIVEAGASNPPNPVNPVNSVKETPCRPSSNTSVFSAAGNPALSSNDVVRGYRLETVRTNAADFSKRPTNARLVGTWHLTDAYRGRARAQLNGFCFPIGSHVVTSLWAHTWGKVRPQLRNASNEIVVIGEPMFARHGQSFLWTAATTNGSVLLTWENFFLGNPYERKETTDCHGLTRIEGEKPTALNTEGVEERRHGGDKKEVATTTLGTGAASPLTSPCLSNSVTSVLSAAGISAREEIRVNPCQSVVHPAINAQLELFPNGDFIARSNDIERVYRRVNPDDWDDDGIPNDEDDAPLVAADEPQFGPHQTLPEGANTNAYCWVDLVVRRANAKVTFTGDGESDLADPAFIAEADVTNRVTLLIGKTYRVTCPMPFELVGKSSDDIEESWKENGVALRLNWPVSIALKPTALNTEETEAGRRGESYKRACQAVASATLIYSPCLRPSYTSVFSESNTPATSFTLLPSFQTFSKPSKLPKPFTMHVSPSGLGGAFTWTNVCCRVSGDGCTFTVTCGDGCSCGGCTATGFLEYEGYRLPAYGGFCGCSGSIDHPGGEEDPDEKPPLPGASATFSKRVVFFEDEYENTPGETAPWRSTETELDCWAYGGTRGGHVRIEIAGADGLVPYGGSPLPFEQDLEPGEEVAFKNTYRAVRPSGGKDDIVVTATFTENETGWTESTVDKATAVKVSVRPRVHAPENDNEFRHKFGVGEVVDCAYQPESAAVIPVRMGKGTVSEKVGSFEYRCPLRGETSGFGLSGGGAEYIPHTSVVEPHAVLAKDAWYEEREVSDGLAGGILLTMDLYVLPLDVSFSGVKVEEVPDIGGSHSGYFADTFFMSEWFHGVDQGAGDWHLVHGNNRFLIDEAGFKRALPQLGNDGFVSSNGTNGWKNGNLTWDVPCGWADPEVKEGDDPVGTFANGARQVMTIDAQGTVEVRKHANAVQREIGGGIFLNGVRVK